MKLFGILIASQLIAIGQEPSAILRLPEDRWALVVGVSKYDARPIGELYGSQDAEAIADDLKHVSGFANDHVIVLDDKQQSGGPSCQTDTLEPRLTGLPTRDNIVDCVSWLARNVSPEGLIVIFFSGHGVSIGDNTFLLAQNTPNTSDTDRLKERAVGAETLIEPMLRRAPNRQFIIFIDACREGKDKTKGPDASDRLSKGFSEILSERMQNSGIKAFATVFSTEPGYSAYSYSQMEMSAFSWVLHQAFRGEQGLNGKPSAYDKDGFLTLQTLVDYLQENTPLLVKQTNDGKVQNPWPRIEGFRAGRLALAASADLRQSGAPASSLRNITLDKGKSVVIDSPCKLTRLVNSDMNVVDAIVVSTKEVFVTAKGFGESSLVMWCGDIRNVYTVTVPASVTVEKPAPRNAADLEMSYRISQLLQKIETFADAGNSHALASGKTESQVLEALKDFAEGSGVRVRSLHRQYATSSTLALLADIRAQTTPDSDSSEIDRVLGDLSGLEVFLRVQKIPLSDPGAVGGAIIRHFVLPRWREGGFYYVDCPSEAPFC